MADFQLHVLGRVRLTGPTREIALTPFQRHVLRIVAESGDRGVERARMVAILWEAGDDGRTRQRIRQLLHGVRQRCGVDPFAGEAGDALRLDGTLVQSDLEAFDACLVRGEYTRAVDLLFREGRETPRGPGRAFDDWLEGRRADRARRLREAAARCWDTCRDGADWALAQDAAEALLRMDPDDEDALRCLIEARGMMRRLRSAEAAYHDFARVRGGEDRLAERTRALMQRLRRLQRRSPAQPPDHRFPLIGRSDVIRTLRGHVERVRDGAFDIVVVEGDPGIGKSRILDEIRREAEVMGVRCLTTAPGAQERRVAMSTLVDALVQTDVGRHAQAMEEPWRTLVGAFLPPEIVFDRLPEIPPIQESALSRRLLDAFATLLESIAEEEPTLLLIDNLHWADDTSVAVLHFVQRRWRGGSLGVFLARRPAGRGEPTRALRELMTHARAHIILDELEAEDAGQLLEVVGGKGLDPIMSERICGLGGRNPFYLIELIRDYQAGRLRLPAVPTEVASVPVPLQQLFDARVGGLDPDVRACVEAIAVRARPIALDTLASLIGTDLEATAAMVDLLEDRRLVRVDRGMVAVSHDLMRSALYPRIPPARRAVLHLKVADHIVNQERIEPPAELAIHHAKAGRKTSAVQYAARAVEDAIEAGAVAEAAYFLQLMAELEFDPSRQATATAQLAELLHVNREMGRSIESLEVALGRLRKVGLDDRARRIEVRRVEALVETGEFDVAAGMRELRGTKRESRGEDDWASLAVALDYEMHLAHRSTANATIDAIFLELEECVRNGCREAQCRGYSSLTLEVLLGDRFDLAADFGRKAVALAIGDHSLQALAQSRLLMVLVCQGKITTPEVGQLLEAARASSKAAGDLALRYFVELNAGVGWMDAGDYDRAEASFDRAEVVFKRVPSDSERVKHFYNLGELFVHRGDYHTARHHFLAAEQQLVGHHFPEMTQLICAGLGLTELQLGGMHTAKRRWRWLQLHPTHGVYDPYLLIAFSYYFEKRYGSLDTAQAFAVQTAARLEHRLPVAWIKAQELLFHIERDLPPPHFNEARRAAELAIALGLDRRAHQIATALTGRA